MCEPGTECVAELHPRSAQMWTQMQAATRCMPSPCRLYVGWLELAHACSHNGVTMQASSSGLVGEDAAYFDVQQQSAPKWAFFTAELAVVLGIMYVVGACTPLVS